jgi:CRISPR-associated protein (TIGR02710 family)
MNDEASQIDQLTAEWRSQSAADQQQFYQERVWPLVKAKFVRENSGFPPPGVLIQLVGTSPDPLILSVLALRPKRVHFVCSAKSEEELDRVVAETALPPSAWAKSVLTGLDARETYREVKRQLDAHQEWALALDITGGKKAMVAGAALSGFLSNVPCYYVDNTRYDTDLRKPAPGTEFLAKLQNPYEVFGCVDEGNADKLVGSGDFAGAKLIYDSLFQRVPDPRCCEVKSLVANAYALWDDFKFALALDALTTAIRKAEQYELFSEQIPVWKRLHEVLDHLKGDRRDRYRELLEDKSYFESAALSLVLKAERSFDAGQFAMAAVCAYRILEIIGQHRLALRGIDSGRVNRDSLTQHEDRFAELHERLHGTRSGIPDQLALINAWTLLFVVRDDLFPRDARENKLEELKGKTASRNELWPEHRNRVIDAPECRAFLDYSLRWLEQLIPDLRQRLEQARFTRF